MGYYSDLDDFFGDDQQAEEHHQEDLYKEQLKAAAKKRAVQIEVAKHLKAEVTGSKVEVKCLCCRDVFTARIADRKRGWAKYCSKSCKAQKQMKK